MEKRVMVSVREREEFVGEEDMMGCRTTMLVGNVKVEMSQTMLY